MFAAFGKGDAQRFGRFDGIAEKQFVKITHAVKKQAVGIGIFDSKKLLHHGRRLIGSCFLDVFLGGCLVGHETDLASVKVFATASLCIKWVELIGRQRINS